METKNVIKAADFKDDHLNKVGIVGTTELNSDVYYFNPGQTLAYHKHPTGDQIFFIMEGKGTFYLDAGTEEKIEVEPGTVILAPKDTWHRLDADKGVKLVAAQATKQPAGMIVRTA